MRCRGFVVVILLTGGFLFCVRVSAQVDTARRVATGTSVYGGYSWLSKSFNSDDLISRGGMNGWTADLTLPLTRRINLKAEGLGFYETSYEIPVRAHFLLAGPQVQHQLGRELLFAQGLIGIGHLNSKALALGGEPAGRTNSFAADLGAGIDFPVLPRIAWRVEGGLVNSHFTATSDQIHGVPTWFERISTGIVFRL